MSEKEYAEEIGYLRGRVEQVERRQERFEESQGKMHFLLNDKLDNLISNQRKQMSFIAGAAFAFSVLWTILLSGKEMILKWVKG